MNPSGDPNHSGAAAAGPCGDEFPRDDHFLRHPTPTTGSLDGAASNYAVSCFGCAMASMRSLASIGR
jgi:hypothetical protein